MIPRCFFDPAQRQDQQVRLPRETSHYLLSVMRKSIGDAVVLLDNSGWEYSAVIEQVEGKELICRIEDQRPNLAEPRVQLILVQGIPKGEQFDAIIQRGTELGVSRFIPLLSDYGQVRWHYERAEHKLSRWQTIAREAAEQSERGRIPAILPPVSWDSIWSLLPQSALCFCFHARGGVPYKQALASVVVTPEVPLVLFIGPEGGWSDAEVTAIRARDIPLVSLNHRVLRTATAAIAAAAVTMHILD